MFSSEGLFLVCALCVIFFSFTVQYREIAVLVAKLLFQCSDPVLVNENCEDIRYFIHIGLHIFTWFLFLKSFSVAKLLEVGVNNFS